MLWLQRQASVHALKLLDELVRPASGKVCPLVGSLDLSKPDLDDNFLMELNDIVWLLSTRLKGIILKENRVTLCHTWRQLSVAPLRFRNATEDPLCAELCSLQCRG